MSFLNELVAEMSFESKETDADKTSQLLNYAIESTNIDIDRTLGFMQAVNDNYEKHFSKGDESFENYQAYRQSAEIIFAASGIDVPVEVMVPSFESLTFANYSVEAEEKKGNVLQRAWAALANLVKRVWEFLTGKKKEVKEIVEQVKVDVVEAQKKVTVAKEEVKKGVKKTGGDDSTSDTPAVYSLKDVTFAAKVHGDFVEGGGVDFTKTVVKVKNSLGVKLANEYTSKMPTERVSEFRKKLGTGPESMKPLQPVKEVQLNGAEVENAINMIKVDSIVESAAAMDKLTKEYATLKDRIESLAKKADQKLSKEDNLVNTAELGNLRHRSALLGSISSELQKGTKALKAVSSTAKNLSTRLETLTGKAS